MIGLLALSCKQLISQSSELLIIALAAIIICFIICLTAFSIRCIALEYEYILHINAIENAKKYRNNREE